MLCNICKQNEAKVHLTTIVDDQIKKVDLCESCSKEKGVADPTSYALADLLLGLGASQEMEQAVGAESKCPNCGFTQADFKKAGRFGCSECYVTFADGLDGLLQTMHKGVRHIGKVPLALQQGRELADRLKSLQKKLDKAVTEEDFEQAAILRDEIKNVKTKASAAPTV